jgi:copper chaperone NosL
MKAKIWCGILIVAFLLTGFSAWGQTADDIKKHPTCTYCGMDREKYNFSRTLTTYTDDSEFGACSLHCAAIDLAANMGKTPKAIQVADYNTKKLADAEKATWVIGGKKPGVMTKVAKWAFENPEDAKAYVKDNEGKVASFEDAMKTTYEDMYTDTKMIRAKKAEMKKKMEQEKKP